MPGGNPPDKPYQVLTLSDDDAEATQQLQEARDNGLEVLFVVPYASDNVTRVILGNYKTNS